MYDNKFGNCMKLDRFIKMCLNKTSCKFCTLDGQTFFCYIFCSECLKKGDAPSLLPCNFSLEYAIERVLANQEGSKLSGTHQHLAYVVDVNLLGQSIHTIKKNT